MSVPRAPSKAQIERMRAEAARERWKRTLAAKKGAATRRRRLLAPLERAEAREQLQEALDVAKEDFVVGEIEKTVAQARSIIEQPVRNISEKNRQKAAFADAERELARLRAEKFHPSEEFVLREKAAVSVQLGREMVEEAVLEFYEKAKAEGRIERISKTHKPGTIAKVNYRERFGIVADRRDGQLLSEANLEGQLQKMLQAAEAVGKRQKGGKLYATFSYFEYGKDKPRSGYLIPMDKRGDPSKGVVKDELGYFYQSFDATNYLGGADDPAGLEAKLRTVLERKITEGGGRNATVLVGFQMKSYVERSPEEQKEFDRRIWRKIKAAERRAAKKKEGEKQWINLEDLEKKD